MPFEKGCHSHLGRMWSTAREDDGCQGPWPSHFSNMKQCWQPYVTPWNFHAHNTYQQSWALETPWYPRVCGWSMNLDPIARRWQYLDYHSLIWFIDSFIICWLRLSFYSLTIRSNPFLLVRLSPTKNPGWIWVPTCPSTLAESQTKSLFEAPNIELELKKMDTKRNWRWYISFCCLLWFDHLPLLFFSFFINDVTICAFFWKICACWIIERQTFRRNILFVQVVPELPPHLTEIGVALITGAENFCPCAWQVGWTGSELNLTHFQIPAVEDVRSKDMAINCTVFKQDPFTIYKKPNVENRRWSRWTWLSCCRSFSIGT